MYMHPDRARLLGWQPQERPIPSHRPHIASMLSAFRLLTLEHPDPKSELFEQVHNEPRTTFTFPNFRKLPIEIRLIIWRFLFPSRQFVSFSILTQGRYFDGAGLLDAKLPVGLSINHESRTEILKHYAVLFVRQECQDKYGEFDMGRAFSFNPKVDRAYIQMDDILDHCTGKDDVLSLFRQNPKVFDEIWILEVRDCDWG